MKNALLILSCVLFSLELYAQDKIIMQSGDTITGIIANYDKKNIRYVPYDDPDFGSASVPVFKVSKIRFDNGKVIDFGKAKYPGAYIGLWAGVSSPVSDFSQNNYDDNRSGFAKMRGVSGGLEGRMPIYKFLGLSGDIRTGTFGIDQDAFFRAENDRLRGDTLKVVGELAHYWFVSFAAGPDIGLKLGNRFLFFIPVHAGYIHMNNSNADQLHYQFDDFEGSHYDVMHSEREIKGNGLGYAFGLHFETRIGGHIGLGAGFKFNHYVTTMTATEKYRSASSTGSNYSIEYSWKQNVSYFQAGLSVRYHLKK